MIEELYEEVLAHSTVLHERNKHLELLVDTLNRQLDTERRLELNTRAMNSLVDMLKNIGEIDEVD